MCIYIYGSRVPGHARTYDTHGTSAKSKDLQTRKPHSWRWPGRQPCLRGIRPGASTSSGECCETSYGRDSTPCWPQVRILMQTCGLLWAQKNRAREQAHRIAHLPKWRSLRDSTAAIGKYPTQCHRGSSDCLDVNISPSLPHQCLIAISWFCATTGRL